MRLAVLSSEEMTTDQLALYRDILGGPRGQGPRAVALSTGAGGLAGPFNAMLYAPAVGHALQELGVAIRFRTELTPRVIAGMVKHTTTIFDMFTGQHGKDEESDIVFHVTPSAN